MLTLAVLGPVEVRRDGSVVRVPGGKTTELLVRLALEAGSPVRAERLLEDLWPSSAHAAAANTLQAKVSRLRRALVDPGLVQGDGTRYPLVRGPRGGGAARVRGRGGHRAAGRCAAGQVGARAGCKRGLVLFQGHVLPAASHAEWAHPYRARLESTRLRL